MRRSPREGGIGEDVHAGDAAAASRGTTRTTRRRESVDDRNAKVSELLHEVAETHHRVYRITGGADDDWASWYSNWLVTLSELPELLGARVVRSQLTYLLVRLDKEYAERSPAEPWEDYYARALVDQLGEG
jgi:hypothetical protein